MITMEPYDVYRAYLALKLHFTTSKYDIIQQQGRVKASKQAFFKRKDLHAIKKISEEYTDKEIVNFLVANFVSGDRWGGVFDSEANANYVSWKKRMQSVTYTFSNELDKIKNLLDNRNISYSDLFNCSGGHPLIVKIYIRKEISIETLVILNKINNFTDKLDALLSDDIMWPSISMVLKKYSPFLRIDKIKYNEIFRTRLGYD